MNHEPFFRITTLLLYALFHSIRFFYALRVTKSGGKIFSGADDIKRKGFFHAALGMAMEIVLPAGIILYVADPWWARLLSLSFPFWLRISGGVLSVACIILLLYVHQALGRHWSTSLRLRDEHRLITAGPYARVRHPMYTALIGNMLGFALLSANLFVLVPRLVQMLLLCIRIPREEAMMIEEFGDDYRTYMRRTGRLLPRSTA
ncbi:MAG: isoprenylcysteine carboxylmethyltransferase family protein [Pyrinomonadaceae bacterium]